MGIARKSKTAEQLAICISRRGSQQIVGSQALQKMSNVYACKMFRIQIRRASKDEDWNAEHRNVSGLSEGIAFDTPNVFSESRRRILECGLTLSQKRVHT
jgi:hypothetical protein